MTQNRTHILDSVGSSLQQKFTNTTKIVNFFCHSFGFGGFEFFLYQIFYFFVVLAQKCLKPCGNGVLKFQFFFFNLSSKVLASVGVRTSKYPYMDICALLKQKTTVQQI